MNHAELFPISYSATEKEKGYACVHYARVEEDAEKVEIDVVRRRMRSSIAICIAHSEVNWYCIAYGILREIRTLNIETTP